VKTLEHPPHSTDLAASDFYLLSQVKSVLLGRYFCNTTDIIKNAPDELKRISQNDKYEYLQNLESR
jgi:hypothetical protein